MHRVAMRQAILIVNTFLINKNRSFGRDIISIWKTFLIDKTTISIVIKNQGQVLLLLWICFKSLTIYHFAFFSISNWFEKKECVVVNREIVQGWKNFNSKIVVPNNKRGRQLKVNLVAKNKLKQDFE